MARRRATPYTRRGKEVLAFALSIFQRTLSAVPPFIRFAFRRSTLVRTRDTLTIIGLVGAGFWAVYRFYLEKIEEPEVFRQRNGFVNCSVKLERAGTWADPQSHLLRATVNVENPAKVRVLALVMYYRATGYKARYYEWDRKSYVSELIKASRESSDFSHSSFLIVDSPKQLLVGQLCPRYLEPGEKRTWTFWFIAPLHYRMFNFFLSLACVKDASEIGLRMDSPDLERLDRFLVRFRRPKPYDTLTDVMDDRIPWDPLDPVANEKDNRFLESIGYAVATNEQDLLLQ